MTRTLAALGLCACLAAATPALAAGPAQDNAASQAAATTSVQAQGQAVQTNLQHSLENQGRLSPQTEAAVRQAEQSAPAQSGASQPAQAKKGKAIYGDIIIHK